MSSSQVEAPKASSSVKKKAANPEPEGGWDAACLSLLNKLLKHKDAWPFAEPVDAKALKLKDYHKVGGGPAHEPLKISWLVIVIFVQVSA